MRRIIGIAAALLLVAPTVGTAQVQRTVSSDRCSGAITTGGVSQVAANGDSSRSWLMVQNPLNATEPLYVDFGPNHLASATLSYQLAPGGSLTFNGGTVPISQINVAAATAGHTYICETGR